MFDEFDEDDDYDDQVIDHEGQPSYWQSRLPVLGNKSFLAAIIGACVLLVLADWWIGQVFSGEVAGLIIAAEFMLGPVAIVVWDFLAFRKTHPEKRQPAFIPNIIEQFSPEDTPRSLDPRRQHFEQLVSEALSSLPDEFQKLMDNVEVVVEDQPSPAELQAAKIHHNHLLLGLYHGIPRTERNSGYNFTLPDKISIYRRPIETICHSDADVRREVRKTVIHEVGHHFGFGDDELHALGW